MTTPLPLLYDDPDVPVALDLDCEVVHLYPLADNVHDLNDDGDCPCSPDVETVTRVDGSPGRVVTHHTRGAST